MDADILVAIGETFHASLRQNHVFAQLMDGLISKKLYVVSYLCQTYHYTRYTTRFLRRSAARLEAQGRRLDIVDSIQKKKAEEVGHHIWALKDAITLGADAAIVDQVPPSEAVQAYIEYNTLMSEESSPLAILGTSFMLEYIAARSVRQTIEALKSRSPIAGISGALRFLEGHAADEEHIEDLRSLLHSVDDPLDQQAIMVSAHVTKILFPRFFPCKVVCPPALLAA